MFHITQFEIEPSGLGFFSVFFRAPDAKPSCIANSLTIEQAAHLVRAMCDERQ